MSSAFIAIGSNMGDRLTNLSRAVDAVAHVPETHVQAISHAYESEPAYVEDQKAFLNAVIKVDTGMEPDALLGYLLEIEDQMGRVRESANGPRVLDLDLLLYGAEERVSETLVLPHPRMLERDFVVTPLLEIEPELTMPDGTRPDRAAASVGLIVRDLGPIPDAGAEHNMPIAETEWVVVAEGEGPQSTLGGFDAALQFKRKVLEQEQIPFAFEPFEPGADIDILGRPQTFRLVVPEAFAPTAIALLEAVDQAPVEE